MTLQETKEIILKWINSCNTCEQADLLIPVIVSHVIVPFDKKVTELELNMAKEDLINSINDRKLFIVKNSRSINVPTLDRYLDDLIN